MSSSNQIQEINELLNLTVDTIREDNSHLTPADIGLAFRVVSDYIENGEDVVERNIQTLRIAADILQAKHTIEDLSWFDIYDCFIQGHTKIEKSVHSESSQVDREKNIESIFSTFEKREVTNNHEDDFIDNVLTVVEMATSEEAEQLQNKDFPDENFSQFEKSLNSRSGFLYGEVEIPNNISRMKIIDIIETNKYEKLNEEDFQWMMRTLREWVRLYSRAEATITNRNITHEELRNFMLNEETPAERYWK